MRVVKLFFEAVLCVDLLDAVEDSDECSVEALVLWIKVPDTAPAVLVVEDVEVSDEDADVNVEDAEVNIEDAEVNVEDAEVNVEVAAIVVNVPDTAPTVLDVAAWVLWLPLPTTPVELLPDGMPPEGMVPEGAPPAPPVWFPEPPEPPTPLAESLFTTPPSAVRCAAAVTVLV